MRPTLTLTLLCVLSASLLAQMPMPSPEQIDQQMAAAIASLPLVAAEKDEEAAAHPVDVEYRQLPTDPAELVRSQVPSIPGGADPDALVRQFMPQAMPFLKKHMRDIGVLRCTTPLKVGRETIPAGEHSLGFICEDDAYAPAALVISGDDLEEEVIVKLKRKRSKESFDTLVISVEGSRKDVALVVGWAATVSTSKDLKPVDDD